MSRPTPSPLRHPIITAAMSAPAPSPANQLYLGPSGGQPEPVGLFSYIWNEQIMNPAHREGNLKCVSPRRLSSFKKIDGAELGGRCAHLNAIANLAASLALLASSPSASPSSGVTWPRPSSRSSRRKLSCRPEADFRCNHTMYNSHAYHSHG